MLDRPSALNSFTYENESPKKTVCSPGPWSSLRGEEGRYGLQCSSLSHGGHRARAAAEGRCGGEVFRMEGGQVGVMF